MIRYILPLVATVCITACGSKKQEEKKAEAPADETTVSVTEAQIKNAGIAVGKPEKRDMATTLTLNGTIDVPPQNMISVSFPLGGYLKSTSLLPGMHVNKGQVLAVLEDMQFIQLQQDYLTAKAKLVVAEAEHSRQQELNSSKASSDKVFQQARAEMETQRILVKALQQKLSLLGIDTEKLTESNLSKSVNIYSPINGFVSKVNVNMGKYTSPTDVLFELVNPEDIHLNLTVFEKDVALLSEGQKIMAYTNNKPKEKHEAEIILISRSLDNNRAAEVHCHFEEYDKTLLPGMFMNAEVSVKNSNALAVPEEAVVRWQNEYYVFEAKGNNIFSMVKIKPGAISNGWQEIEGDNINTSSSLVLKNAYALLMKMKNTAEE
ncbi:membrane fusion protein, cobalt-zinc-cadmium efflux system [Filimonas lacunae]|uniref:Membrane fusion protein, cobalt-zinc-cadmium efflux system n=1 Tax=Filimonas lacunae TaxID=477680 RepID=A0A173MQA0_9BACT|nr:efflux RND transporter periplasmic adaptor subunit [Filimonas lacunae]BAV09667.1 Co/Zn/Cd efflux system membrane fusion protein [Filimonas lacunae]SIS76859.1 membrane fusion protein, cobalt-zinc-cadmium efflux system [Filimonas lacunae]